MKTIVILGDGMADLPLKNFGGRTPLEIAKKPNMDRLCKDGETGLVKTVPDTLKPGSDVANLAVMGYNPEKYYTGRSPLEAVSMGIKMKADDIALRCNLVTLSDEENYRDKTMLDYSAGEISTEEAAILIDAVNKELSEKDLNFYPGISYRHCLIAKGHDTKAELTPPHDISDKQIKDYLPKGGFGEIYEKLMRKSYEILKDHPVNLKRKQKGLNPANSIWLWGAGSKPELDDFKKKNGVSGAVISAVDLVKGIGICAGMKIFNVDGATGNINTNFSGKAKTAIDALSEYDFVYLHIEAPDECGHHGDTEGKIKSIELIDEKVVAPVADYLERRGNKFNILIMPDHPTPIGLKTHTKEPVPYLLYRNYRPMECGLAYNEKNALKSGNFIEYGYTLIDKVLNG